MQCYQGALAGPAGKQRQRRLLHAWGEEEAVDRHRRVSLRILHCSCFFFSPSSAAEVPLMFRGPAKKKKQKRTTPSSSRGKASEAHSTTKPRQVVRVAPRPPRGTSRMQDTLRRRLNAMQGNRSARLPRSERSPSHGFEGGVTRGCP